MFGLGRSGADRLGYLDGLRNRRGESTVTYEVDRRGNRRPGVGFADLPGGAAPWMMLRGDVERAAFESLPESAEVRYSTRPTAITHDATTAHVTLTNTATGDVSDETFDLVVGADGIHSSVRRLVFGPHERYKHRLGYMICAFELPESLPGMKQDEGAILAEPGRSFWVFPFKDHPSTVLFSYRTDDVDAERAMPAVERLREVYGPEPLGELMESALRVLENADEYLFDSVEQVRMDRWHQGPVVLVGDAAWCPTLYSGMGASTAVGASSLLGRALAEHPDDVQTALERWEELTRPYVADFQKEGVTNRITFTPADERETTLRRVRFTLLRRLMANSALGALLMKTPMFRRRNQDLAALL